MNGGVELLHLGDFLFYFIFWRKDDDLGRGLYLQLGHGNDDDALLPTRVGVGGGKSRVVAVSTNSDYSAAVTAEGQLFTWGGGRLLGRLGHGDPVPRPVPTLVKRAGYDESTRPHPTQPHPTPHTVIITRRRLRSTSLGTVSKAPRTATSLHHRTSIEEHV